MLWFVAVILLILLVLLLIWGIYNLLTSVPRLEVYRDESYKGHEVVIYRQGYPLGFRSGYHKMIVVIDGKEILHCWEEIHGEGESNLSALKNAIQCETDDSGLYVITVGYTRMRFSSDFRTIYDFRGYDVEFLDDSVTVEKWSSENVIFKF